MKKIVSDLFNGAIDLLAAIFICIWKRAQKVPNWVYLTIAGLLIALAVLGMAYTA